MMWRETTRGCVRARALADRHYNRQKVGASQFVPPGRCLVLHAETATGEAFWVTSWPFAEYVKHDWAGAWMCSAFRSEGAGQASGLIRQALAATRARFGEPPELGLVTFINPKFVRPTKVRGVEVYGWTWLKAGFRFVGYTKGGLLAFQIAPQDIPAAEAPLGLQLSMIG